MRTTTKRRRPVGRTCCDCREPYSLTEEHTDKQWCPACVGNHFKRCALCTAPFRADGVSKLCPCCTTQPALFDTYASTGGA